MNLEQVAWAKQHDWFLSSTVLADGNYKVVVMEEGAWNRCEHFTSFHNLYIWAGSKK